MAIKLDDSSCYQSESNQSVFDSEQDYQNRNIMNSFILNESNNEQKKQRATDQNAKEQK